MGRRELPQQNNESKSSSEADLALSNEKKNAADMAIREAGMTKKRVLSEAEEIEAKIADAKVTLRTTLEEIRKADENKKNAENGLATFIAESKDTEKKITEEIDAKRQELAGHEESILSNKTFLGKQEQAKTEIERNTLLIGDGIKKLQAIKASLETETKAANEKIAALDASIAEKNKEIESIDKIISEKRNEVSEVDRKKDTLVSLMGVHDETIKTNIQTIAGHENEISDLKEEIKNLKDKSEKLELECNDRLITAVNAEQRVEFKTKQLKQQIDSAKANKLIKDFIL